MGHVVSIDNGLQHAYSIGYDMGSGNRRIGAIVPLAGAQGAQAVDVDGFGSGSQGAGHRQDGRD